MEISNKGVIKLQGLVILEVKLICVIKDNFNVQISNLIANKVLTILNIVFNQNLYENKRKIINWQFSCSQIIYVSVSSNPLLVFSIKNLHMNLHVLLFIYFVAFLSSKTVTKIFVFKIKRIRKIQYNII